MLREKLGKGCVHDTYLVKNNDGSPAYVLQRLNTIAFKNPQKLMENILKVTSYIKSCGGITLEFIPFENGEYIMEDNDGVWRKTKYIDAYSTDTTDDQLLIEGTGIAFGSFLQDIQGFNDSLYDTIPQFHNTEKRIADCLLAADKDLFGRVDNAKALLNELERRSNNIISDYKSLLSCGPQRITHNDTKISNVLFDRHSLKPICVIDLDTVMLGMTLYDFGDAARAIAFELKQNKLYFNQQKYECFENAYLSKTEDILTKDEKMNFLLATYTITTELGIRYLEDYLNGDQYFNVSSPLENLTKARAMLEYTLRI